MVAEKVASTRDAVDNAGDAGVDVGGVTLCVGGLVGADVTDEQEISAAPETTSTKNRIAARGDTAARSIAGTGAT